jgi:hypothetical protein
MNSNGFYVDTLPFVVILLLFGSMGVYLLYAGIKKDPLSDPDSIASFLASFPGWPKRLTRELFIIIGAAFCILSLFSLVGGLLEYIK